MNHRPVERVISFVLATLITAGMLGAIDGLAGLEEASATWAAAVMSKQRGRG